MRMLAFYKGKGSWIDWGIRLITRSPYSHVELIAEPAHQGQDGSFTCYSSSARDGGVRCTTIEFKKYHWDFVPIEFPVENITALFEKHDGAKYDYWAILFSQFFNWHIQSPNRWFCSEICAAALGLPNPASYSPASLKDTALFINKIYTQAKKETS